jgi:VanZ family protein
MTSISPFSRRSDFVGLATLAYVVVVAIASVYPAEDWRIPDRSVLWRQLSEWPRYYTYNDVIFNVAAYIPVGLLFTLWLRRHRHAIRAAGIAFALASLLSASMEVLQGGIPLRVPSALDVFCNSVGGLLGAWFALFWSDDDGDGAFARWRSRFLAPDRSGDAGLVLLGLWVLAQFRPDLWLFSTGDLRHMTTALPGTYSALTYVAFEAGVAVCGIVTIAGILRVLAAENPVGALIVMMLSGLAARSLATAVLFDGGHALLWITPGNGLGIAAGLGLAIMACMMPRHAAALVAFGAMLAGTVLLNAGPLNPYASIAGVESWQQGHYRSFAGTTRILALSWPFLAAVFLLPHVRRRH